MAKVAYVTGGMGGIGTAICQRLSKGGFTVIAGCGPSRDFNKWLGEQKALGYNFHASVGNVADWDSTDAATYEYLGLGQFVIQKYPEPSTDLAYTLAKGSGSSTRRAPPGAATSTSR